MQLGVVISDHPCGFRMALWFSSRPPNGGGAHFGVT
jgi:hypothetical protein